VSAATDEGVNDAAANFAVSLAQTGVRVLLVDADLRQPQLHEIFGIPNGSGLGDFLSGSNVSVSKPVTSLPSLSLVTAGTAPSFPSEALSSIKMKSALESWKSTYNYIVWLTAPLLSVSDGMPLAKWSDETVLVTRYGVTKMRTLGPAHKLLEQSGANVVGFVVLDVPKSSGTFTGQILNPETRHA
jgi:capsular exopolysaccharide synthesis family protein